MLTAAIGLGGLAGAAGALGLSGGRGLGRVFVVALAAWGLPLALIGAVPVPAVALAALFATGVSNAVLDVSGFTLMQRGVSNEDRVTVFAASEACGEPVCSSAACWPRLSSRSSARVELSSLLALFYLCSRWSRGVRSRADRRRRATRRRTSRCCAEILSSRRFR